MSSFKIEGGHSLKGEITPQGAKNEALQVICSVLLTSKNVTLSNVVFDFIIFFFESINIVNTIINSYTDCNRGNSDCHHI